MAVVTGKYVTPSGAALPAGVLPQVEVIPSKPTVTVNDQLIATKTDPVTPGSDGSFTLNLIPTVDVTEADFHYVIRGYYLEPDGYDASNGYTRVDLFEQKLYVPTAGGTVGELAQHGRFFKTWVIVQLNEPPFVIPGALWYQADPADENVGSGYLYEGEL